MVSIMLMNGVSLEEAKARADRIHTEAQKGFAKEAPMIQEELKLIQTPLTFNDITSIYRWLCRKQITIEMIPENVLDEFKKTEQYDEIIRRREER